MTGSERRQGINDTESPHPISREKAVIDDMQSKIQRYNIPRAVKLFKPRVSRNNPSDKNLDFIGNCSKWCDQSLVGLFGPDIAFADVVLLGQIAELRKEIPKNMLKRFKNGLSDGEVAFYYYRYHLASVRHKSDVRTLRSPRNRQKQIYPFVIAEYPKDPTNKLLTLTLDHPSIQLPDDQHCGQPNVSLLYELIAALSAWAFQTGHAIAPSHSVLQILLQTQGTESEFDYIRRRLAEQNMIIYTPEKVMEESRGWVGGELNFEVLDDLCFDVDEDEGLLASPTQISQYLDHSAVGLALPWTSHSQFSYRSTVDVRPSPSHGDCPRRLSRPSPDPSSTFHTDAKTSLNKEMSDLLAGSSNTNVMNFPAVPGGTPYEGAFLSDSGLPHARLSEPDESPTKLPLAHKNKSQESEDTISDHEVVKSCCRVS